MRHSPITSGPFRAATPGNAALNYMLRCAQAELVTALRAASLDPGIGIGHIDREYRPALAFDALEALRPLVEATLLQWLDAAVFAKLDFVEEPNGEIRSATPLAAHLALASSLWRTPAAAVAGWIASRLRGEDKPLTLPFTASTAGTWDGRSRSMLPRCCVECGSRLVGQQRKYCSAACAASHSVAAADDPAGPVTPERARQRENLNARRLWDEQHGRYRRKAWSVPTREVERSWYQREIRPKMASVSVAELARATGLSVRWIYTIRGGATPHPRHFAALAKLAGVELPKGLR